MRSPSIPLFGALAFILLVTTIGCSHPGGDPFAPPVSHTPESVNSPTHQESNVAPIAQATDLAPSATKTGIPTSTTSQEPTAVPLPTLSSTEAETLIRSLFQPDDSCRLPCWWNAKPGITQWQQVEPFLTSIASEIHRTANPQGSVVSYEIYFYYPSQEQPTAGLGAFYYLKDNIISEIELSLSNSLNWSSTYSLPQILIDYGPPEEIWIGTYDNTPSGVRPFRISLLYSEQGFVANYETRDVTKEGEAIVGCPLASPPRVFLWLTSGEAPISFERARLQTLQIGDDQLYLPLQEATELTIDDFYSLFTESTDAKCLSTPAKLWPY